MERLIGEFLREPLGVTTYFTNNWMHILESFSNACLKGVNDYNLNIDSKAQ